MRKRFDVAGVVQGVGFRPWVHSEATKRSLSGFVANVGLGVTGEVEGPEPEVIEFIDRLATGPPLSRVDRVTSGPCSPTGTPGFAIAPSRASRERGDVLPADVATCADCLAEINDPANRRYRHAFANCTNCGPRLTVVEDLPYDRERTTMAGFAMCADCTREYSDVTDRRFHAEPICCPACGPTLRWCTGSGEELDVGDDDPVRLAGAALRSGQIIALKGVGGYHLAVLASDEVAVARLRSAKHREDKPFAVMVPDLVTAGSLCELTEVDRALLVGPAAPIVIMPRRGDRPPGMVARSVAPANRSLGLMLPYSPLHHLLMAEVGAPIVLTSGNRADEPMAIANSDAFERLAGIADRFLAHDRPIRTRADDSIARVVRGSPTILRRARGWAPHSFALGRAPSRPILGVGAELKSTFALTVGDRLVLSQHLGDLAHPDALDSYLDALGSYRRIFGVRPEVVAHDLHPQYLSTRIALEMDGVETVAVQHHHAHIAACLAEHAETGPVLGVAYDGSGYGGDGTIWGGELLIADRVSAARVGHLDPVRMPGGAAAIREPWRMAVAHLAAIGAGAPELRRRHGDRWETVASLAAAESLSPLTSSMGRLFDAVAALLGVRDETSYEGQAAIELEQLAEPGVEAGYPAAVAEAPDDGLVRLVGGELIAAVVEDLSRGAERAVIASRFQLGVVATTMAALERLRGTTGIGTVACSGGVFQNAFLVERLVVGLRAAGFRVLLHRDLPPNDGCISVGQVTVAAAREVGDRDQSPSRGR